MSTYAQHKAITKQATLDKIVSLYQKLDDLKANPETTKRQIGAATAQITKTRYNHFEAIHGQMVRSGAPYRESLDEAGDIAAAEVMQALRNAGRENDKYQ